MAYAFPTPIHETLDISLKEGSGTIEYLVPYADIGAIVVAVLNPAAPSPHPLFAGLICKGVSATMLKLQDGNKWSCVLNFGSPEEDESGDLISYSISIAAESLALPKENYKIGDPPEPLDDSQPAPQKIIPFVEYSITAFHQAALDEATIASLAGYVNDDTFYDHAAEKVMYKGASAEMTIKTDGNAEWTITHNLAVHTATWNQHWNAKNSAWEALDKDLYEQGDFSALGLE